MTLQIFIQAMILLHAALGTLALLSGTVATLAKKGTPLHKKSGKVSAYTAISSISLSLIVAMMPGHFNLLLFSIGVFSLYFYIIGIRSIQYLTSDTNSRFDYYITIIYIISCILMIVLPLLILKIINITTLVFGLIGIIVGMMNLRKFNNTNNLKREWLRMHIIHMSGGFISLISAFLVVNNIFHSMINWFLPTIIGTILIGVTLRKNRQKSYRILTSVTASFISLLLLTSFNLNAQSNEMLKERVFTKAQMIEDYTILYASLTNYHPAPFLYTPENEFKAFYENQKSNFPETLSEREFYVVAKQLIALVKCGHTVGKISPNWLKAMGEQPRLLPFTIKIIGEQVFINNTTNDTFDFETHDELVSINGIPIKSVLNTIASIQERVGNTFSYVNEVLQLYIRVYFYMLYGNQNALNIEYKTKNGIIKTTQVNYTNKNLKVLSNPTLPDNLSLIYHNKWSSFSIDSVNNLAYLKITSFSNRKEYKDYYAKVFQSLEKIPNIQLIIDLRNNGGGYYKSGNTLLTYLSPEKFDFNFQRSKQKIVKNPHTKMEKWNKLTKLAFNLKPAKNKSDGYRIFTFSYKPSKPQFKGKVHVINNGRTFSTSVVVGAQLHQNGATMYGSETGGAENTTNAMAQYNLTLPNSGITTTISYYQVMTNSTKGKFGYGVQPKYEILDGLKNDTDNVLIKVMDIVNQQ
ncbi:MAG TPA: S41 family peptidase [Saprospiraceae bacterium]|nr:S41 family peptidase [Saprospiraceae bacterium]